MKNHNAINFIESIGGAASLARILRLPEKTGTQTVQNWKTRGIPSLVLLDNPKLFREYIKQRSNSNEYKFHVTSLTKPHQPARKRSRMVDPVLGGETEKELFEWIYILRLVMANCYKNKQVVKQKF